MKRTWPAPALASTYRPIVPARRATNELNLAEIDYCERGGGWRPLMSHPARRRVRSENGALVVELGVSAAALIMTDFRLRTRFGGPQPLERQCQDVRGDSIFVRLTPSRRESTAYDLPLPPVARAV